MSQVQIGVNGVESGVLKLIGTQLLEQTDTTALLMFVKDDTGTFLCDDSQGEVQLVMTIASQGMKNITGGALGMNANDRR